MEKTVESHSKQREEYEYKYKETMACFGMQLGHEMCVHMWEGYWHKTLCPEHFGEIRAMWTDFFLSQITLAAEWKVDCR